MLSGHGKAKTAPGRPGAVWKSRPQEVEAPEEEDDDEDDDEDEEVDDDEVVEVAGVDAGDDSPFFVVEVEGALSVEALGDVVDAAARESLR